MKKELITALLGASIGLVVLNTAAWSDYDDYNSNGCQQNERGEMICVGEWVRDLNTGDIGTVVAIAAYGRVGIHISVGRYSGSTYYLAADAVTPSQEPGSYYPYPNPRPYPQPAPTYYPQPSPTYYPAPAYPMPQPAPTYYPNPGPYPGRR